MFHIVPPYFWGEKRLGDQDIYPAEAMVGVVVSNLRQLARGSDPRDLQEIPSRLWLDVMAVKRWNQWFP